MVDAKVHAVLDALHNKKPLPVEETEGRLEKMFKKPVRYLLACTVLSYLILGLLAAAVWLFDLSAKSWLNVALFLFVVSVSTALLWIAADTFPTLVGIFFYRDEFHRTRKLTVIHDLRQAKELHGFDIAALKLTDQWLSLRIERMRVHLGLFFGGSDKVAVLGLVLGGWGIWTNFPSNGLTLEQFGYMVFSAFIGGIGLGGLLANVVIKELAYQRDLLSLALSTASSID